MLDNFIECTAVKTHSILRYLYSYMYVMKSGVKESISENSKLFLRRSLMVMFLKDVKGKLGEFLGTILVLEIQSDSKIPKRFFVCRHQNNGFRKL